MKFFWLIRLLLRSSGKKKKTLKYKNKIKNWGTELPIFKLKIDKYKKILKYTKSPQQMIKVFDNIKEEFNKILKYKSFCSTLEFCEETINCLEDLKKIDKVRDLYIKDFLNSQIEIELAKEKEVTQPFLKEGLIKKALIQALKAVEYLPGDAEMVCKITELEDKLMQCYKENL